MSVGEYKNREINVPLGPLRKERWSSVLLETDKCSPEAFKKGEIVRSTVGAFKKKRWSF